MSNKTTQEAMNFIVQYQIRDSINNDLFLVKKIVPNIHNIYTQQIR